MRAYERLINYAKVYTTSDEYTGTHPSTQRQFDLANMLVKELKDMGLDATLDDKCYIYAKLPATKGYEDKIRLGFIAHVDTAPDYNGKGVNPVLHPNYDGGDVTLGNGQKILVKDFPHLKGLKGRTLLTADGTSLLGADDKAGVAEIMTMVETLIKENVPHGDVLIGFTPDEEIGEGADNFDVAKFGADFGYTIDGDLEGSIEYENFNAHAAVFEIKGVNVHPGTAYDIMVNASLVAMEINSMLPENDVPSRTQNYEGFFHLTDMEGCVEKATLKYIVRDHDFSSSERRLELLRSIESKINAKYGEGTCKLTVREQYRNMAEKIKPVFHLIENAEAAARNVGVTPSVHPIRGGTDGARLSYMGLPCPNLGTGGFAFHGPMEHVSIEGMDAQTKILVELVKIYSKVAR